ncbi:hypothetical protein B0A50_02919 [Salinomyces thailandicus]|uniref:Uncharacterized protein n=1 Tax=Salinomyces thailandicus TaxID=706561 RepID=A0A4U0U299_9PEZI|nr:hypothetical protein B0A50_02919 [Salinomyces thailandica]
MPPRLRLQPGHLVPASPSNTPYICQHCRHASLANATTPAPPLAHTNTTASAPAIARYPPTQPPSYKPPEFRKSQLHRQYQSLLRSSPLLLLFQHNNLKATEWTAIRRELTIALRKVDDDLAAQGEQAASSVANGAKLQIIQTGIFASALKVVDFWTPNFSPNAAAPQGLSAQAYRSATQNAKTQKHTPHRQSSLDPLLSGPLALLTLPEVSPLHLKAALTILAPSKAFPAPKRRVNPAYHEKPVQDGLAKLMLLGARVEGRIFDMEGVRGVGAIPGGLAGLRAQLVGMLGGVGAGVTGALEGMGRGLWVTMEGRRLQMEEEEKKGEAGDKQG